MPGEEDYTDSAILKRMLAAIPDTIDKREGSIIYDALAPAAAELAKMYITLISNIDLVFADTSVNEYLDKLVNQVGMEREEATYAIKKASFYDADKNYMNVSIGSRFTCEDLYWTVIEKISDGVYEIQCESAGSKANNITGNLIPVDYIDGLATATITELLIPGEDEETDDELRNRYYETINEKAFAGNIADYKKKTKEIQGVGAVKVTPIWDGGGTVKLTILDSEFKKASNVLIEQVQNTICPQKSNLGIGLAPIGHVVTVDTAEETKIDVSANVSITEGSSIDIVKQEVKKQIENYLSELRENWENETNLIVRISQIESRILNIDAVIDISNVKINGNAANIELTEMQIPVQGEVECSEIN